MNFQDIKKFPRCNYMTTVMWTSLERHIAWMQEDYKCDLNPDFQRGHVWTEDQQVKYCEYILRGGTSGKDIFCNCPYWENGKIEGKYTLVDGKQRVQAVSSFIKNEIKVFDNFYKEFEGRLRGTDAFFNWHVAAIESKSDLLEWYLNFNSGGTVHSKEELKRIEIMLKNELKENHEK